MSTYLNFTRIVMFISFFFIALQGYSQVPSDLPDTKEEIMEMTYEELLNLPFEDLIKLADIIGVSTDELLQMILNKEVTTASKSEENIFDSPLSTSMISSEEIKISGATTIEEALRLIPGLIVREKTNGNFDVHIRGLDNIPPGNMLLYSENSMSLVMIDNRVVYNYANGGTFWEALPIGIEDIERIEVIRGPSSALYGPNAVSGVIHFITKKYNESSRHINADVQIGTQNTKIIGLNGGAKIGDDFRFNVYGNYQYRERFQDDFYLFELKRYTSLDSLGILKWPTSGELYERNNVHERFPDPDLGRENYAINLALLYDVNEDINVSLTGGYQNSNSITTPFDNQYYSLTRRTSQTQYADFKAKVYGFNAQVSYMSGPQDVAAKKNAFKYDYSCLDAILEYDYKFKNLRIRPGISYRQANYDDKDYVREELKEGFLNGNKSVNTFSYGIRLDYLAFNKLRFIGALRADKYNYPDKTYLTYQAVASYTMNDKHLFRAVYSRANRSPFVVDLYADYDWRVVETIPVFLPDGAHFYFKGNKALKLATMDMFEIGYRVHPTENIQVDIEAFASRTTDFDLFQLESLNLLVMNTVLISNGAPVNSTSVPYDVTFKYTNSDIVAKQIGVSFDITAVLTKKLYCKLFGTLQETKLENHYPLSLNQNIGIMSANAASVNIPSVTAIDNYLAPGTRTIGLDFGGSNYKPDTSVNATHKATPSFFGGFSMNYTPVKKINSNVNLYYYSKQTLMHSFESMEVDAKMIMNLKISYKFWKESSIYFNARNLLNNKKKEFAFVDDIKGTYLIGVDFRF